MNGCLRGIFCLNWGTSKICTEESWNEELVEGRLII